MKKIEFFFSENFQYLELKFSIFLNRRVFVITTNRIKHEKEYNPTTTEIVIQPA